jgi:hypothetical protein
VTMKMHQINETSSIAIVLLHSRTLESSHVFFYYNALYMSPI